MERQLKEPALITADRRGREGRGLETGTPDTGRRQGPVIALAALAAVALVVNARLTLANVERVRDAEVWVAHTHQMLETLAGLRSSLVDAETGQRGFLVTGRPAYLEPYEAGRTAVERRLFQLDELIRGDPSRQKQVEALRPLVAAKLEELKRTIDLFQKGGAGFEAARAIVLDDEGKRLMDALRANVAEMAANEDGLLDIRARAAATAIRTAVVTTLLGLGASLVLLGAAFAAGRSRLRERERTAARLHEEKERLHTTLTSIGDAVIVTDREGTITMMNRAASSLLGWGDDALGRRLDEVFRIINEETRATVESPVGKVLRENRVVGLANHTVVIRRDGSEVPIDDSGAPIRAADGSVIGVVLVFRSIEERRKAERELQRRGELLQDQDRHKDAFLAMLSHELRNPLAAIRTAVAVLEKAEPTAEKPARAKAVIDHQVTHLTRLIDDLLDLSRIAQGKIRVQKERIDLAEVVRRTVDDHQDLFAREQIALKLRTRDGPLWVNADATRVAQIVGNILQNAAKFTSAGGRVSISVSKEDGRAVLRIRDTGVGIDAATLPKVFQPLFQSETTLHRSAGGLGLGLALTKALVELHDGTVCASSDGPGTGAEFAVSLPLAESPPVPLAAETKRPARRRLSVLLIEDSDDSASTLRDLLELEGHVVRFAADGEHGIEAASAVRPDVVLCDVGLPGLDGYEVARRLRRAGSASVLIALTGYASDVQRAQEAGFHYHLAKPADLEDLLAILARV